MVMVNSDWLARSSETVSWPKYKHTSCGIKSHLCLGGGENRELAVQDNQPTFLRVKFPTHRNSQPQIGQRNENTTECQKKAFCNFVIFLSTQQTCFIFDQGSKTTQMLFRD